MTLATLPAQSSMSSAPRTQRPNRKSAITSALQNHSQSQIAQGQGQRQNGNRPAHQRQSMPAQRSTPVALNNNSKGPVQILKRPSEVAPGTAPAQVATAPPQQRQHQHQHQHQHQQNRNQRPRPQSHNPALNIPSKARRVHRRKDIEAVQESLANIDLDMALNQSPPLTSSSPPSSDSDDSESALSLSSHFLGRPMAHSPLQRPSSAPVVAPMRKGIAAVPARHQNQFRSTAPSHGPFAAAPTGSHFPMDRPAAAKSSSADQVFLADRIAAEKKSTLYAGPTFHNSPAPTSLPIPAFSRSLGSSPVEPSVETMPSPFFAEAASPQLNSMRPQVQPMVGHHHSMPVYPNQHFHPSMVMNYNVPYRMATSSYTPNQMMGPRPVDELTEISHNLRTLLKIQSQ